jgi:hypothetical protein
MSQRWYQVALSNGESVTLASAEGEHPGAAIAAACKRVGRPGRVWPVAAAVVGGAAVPLGESVGRGVVVTGPAGTDYGHFEYPVGVVPLLGDRAHAASSPGYLRSEFQGTGAIDAVIAGAAVRECFLDVVERLTTVDNVEIELAEHHDAPGSREVWLTPRLRDVRRAIRFLDDFDDDCLANGHVDVAVYVRSPRSTWRLTQHKTLAWLSDDAALTDRVADWIAAAGVAAVERLSTVAAVPHLHYRSVSSSLRKRLLARLKSAGLRRVDGDPGRVADRSQ